MDKLRIYGGRRPLKGTIPISGSKNTALPLMAAALLGQGKSTIHNIPHKLKDIQSLSQIIQITGTTITNDYAHQKITIDPETLTHTEIPYNLVTKIRASFYMLGALLGRTGQAKISLPGGCAWGPRPVNLHMEGLKKMGVNIALEGGYIIAKVKKYELKDATFTLQPPSVGATINLALFACSYPIKLILYQAAKEPDVIHILQCLKKMGADIEGIGTDTLTIIGSDSLSSFDIHNIPDRIEVGTFMIACGLVPNSEIKLINCCNKDHLGILVSEFGKTGLNITYQDNEIDIKNFFPIRPISITTSPFPGFPTDLQAQWCLFMTQANGKSTITDNIYYDRFNYVPELNRLGANIILEKNTAYIHGISQLKGAQIMSTDLRASISLVLAGLIADGVTEVLRVYHLDRGYEQIEKKISLLGAIIERI